MNTVVATAQTKAPEVLHPHHVAWLLRLADGSLVLSQRLSEWCGHGPVLEEDIAFSNIALDLLGQARLLYTHAGTLEGQGRDEDAFAYWRDEADFHNPTLVELPNGDFGQSVLRAWAYVSWQCLLWEALAQSRDSALAAIAAKSGKESRYHQEHLGSWVVRLGDGTEESHRRMQVALDYLWPYTRELFHLDAVESAAMQAGIAPGLDRLADTWTAHTNATLHNATLAVPAATPFMATGRQGRHSEAMGYLLNEMQALARAHPGARW